MLTNKLSKNKIILLLYIYSMYTNLVLHRCRPYSRVNKSKIEQKFVNNCSGFLRLIYNFNLLLGSGLI